MINSKAMIKSISSEIKYIGVDDVDLDLFESQYVVPEGMAYNSYVILDDKVAVMDTVDARKGAAWLENLEEALGGRKPDYLVVHHMEPDHSGSILEIARKYPDIQIVGTSGPYSGGEWFDDLHAEFPRCRKWLMGMRNMVASSRHLLTALLWTDGELLKAPIMDINGVVDPSGVGDAFMAGLLHSIQAYPDDPQLQLNYSLAASTLKNTIPGDFNLATDDEITSLL